MTTMVAHSRLTPRVCTISPGELAGIARTFDHAAQAVWVHDVSGRCVYRNRTAGRAIPNADRDTTHDLLDHHDQRIGHIRLRTT